MSPLFWLSYIVRSLRRSGRRTIFAVVCVAVGVAGVVALQTASLTVQNALTSDVRASNGGDISVASDESPLSRSDLGVFQRLQRAGKISAWTAVSSLHATAVGPKHELVPFDVDVVSSPPYPLGGQPTFVSPSNGNVQALLGHSGNVLVTTVLAQELGVGVGSHLVVNSIGGRGLPVVVRGILSETNLQHSAAMTVNQRDAATLTNRPPHYTAVYANLPGSPDAVATSLRADFPSATVQTVAEALQADKAQVHDFQQFLLLVGLLALLIAGIGTLNAMQSMLVRRRLEIAMLKAMGFGQGTLYGLFGGEALLIGIAGGVLGTALGAAASKIVTDALAQAMAIQVVFVLDVGTLVSGVALGIGAALVFAVLPIVRAAGFRPLELLREGASGTTWNGWPLTLGLLALIMVLFSILAAVTLNDLTLAVQLVVIAFVACGLLTGAFSLIVGWMGRLGPSGSPVVGYIVLAVLLALTAIAAVREPAIAAILALGAVLWAATVVLPESALLPLLIAARALSRRQARTAVTLVAFLAGVLSMTLALTVALSLRSQINDALASSRSANLVAITTPQTERAVLRSSGSLPGVKSRTDTTTVSTTPVAVNGLPLASVIGPAPAQNQGDAADERVRLLSGVTGYDLGHGNLPTQINLVEGRTLGPSDAGTNNVIVRSGLLGPPYSLKPGDQVTLKETGTGVTRTVRVVGFYSRPRGVRNFGSFFSEPVVADRSLAMSLGGADAQTVVAFSVDANHLSADAATLQRAVPGALVVDIGDLAAVVEQILNELLNVLAVITALVLGAGVAVVANGVALAMMERRREIALFKAIGFGPGNVLRFVLVENALIGTLAGAVSVLAAAIGLALLSHFALQQAIGFDPVVAVIVLLIAAALAVVTAYLTARTPVRVRPLEALRNE